MRFGKNEMRQLFESGNNTAQIAAACNCTEAEVYNQLHRFRQGVTTSAKKRRSPLLFWNDRRVLEVERLARLGVSVRDVAAIFGKSKKAIHSVSQKHNIKFRRTA